MSLQTFRADINRKPGFDRFTLLIKPPHFKTTNEDIDFSPSYIVNERQILAKKSKVRVYKSVSGDFLRNEFLKYCYLGNQARYTLNVTCRTQVFEVQKRAK